MSSKPSRRDTASEGKSRRILIVAAPGSQILDIAGPVQIFVRASELLNQRKHPVRESYRVEVVTTWTGKSIPTSCGIKLTGDRSFSSVRGPVDTLLVAGGSEIEAGFYQPALLQWLRAMASKVRRLGSICTGAFLLGQAGLLNGKHVTTHWKYCAELTGRCPQTMVDPDPIFVRDGNLYTSAGVTAGMDMALALIEDDFDSSLALDVAREMVIYLRRPGGQSQFSAALSFQKSNRQAFRELEHWDLDHLDSDLSVDLLSRRSAMSPRNFSRAFTREIGITPARFVEYLRVEAARRLLEQTSCGLEQVAKQCGFGSADVMRRAFERIVGTHPSAYRGHFRAAASEPDKAGQPKNTGGVNALVFYFPLDTTGTLLAAAISARNFPALSGCFSASYSSTKSARASLSQSGGGLVCFIRTW
jgi:transcriptional regulator GlxA family with amidase domain